MPFKSTIRITLVVCLLVVVSGVAFANPSKIRRDATRGVPGEWIVVLNDHTPRSGVEGVSNSIASAYGVELINVWADSLKGFFCKSDELSIEALSNDPRVKYVEQNLKTTIPRNGLLSATQWTWFNNEYLWHLDRLDELSRADAGSQHNMCDEGREMVAYVIDTGVQADHPQFESPSRVIESLDFSADRDPNEPVSSDDLTNGCTAGTDSDRYAWHGTAVASVLAGTQVGASKTRVVSLKVMECTTREILTADLIDAVNWIGTTHNTNGPGVVNYSGYRVPWDTQFQAFGDTVEGLATGPRNIPFFTSADNWAGDACLFSPNDRAYTNVDQTGSVFVVGGTSADASADYRYQRWNPDSTQIVGIHPTGVEGGSNAGACVSIYAPAASIFAARHSSYRVDDGDGNPANDLPALYDRADGTSFSSPLVAAIAVRYMERQRNLTGVTPGRQAVYNFLLGQAQTAVNNVQTREFWFCPTGGASGYPGYYFSNPGVCPDSSTPFHSASVGNESNARMAFWDQGVCW